MAFPSPPWHLEAQCWLSVFAVRESGRTDRPAGLYGAAFLDYRPGSVLTYHELLVARVLREGRVPRLRITDIWVDSEQSLAGGRSLWAIPKEMADLPMRETSVGAVERTAFSGVAEGQHLATATFTSLPGAALVRTPLAASASQVRADGTPVVTPLSGSARGLPCRGAWQFDPAGPIGFLHGRRPLVSLRLRDVRIRFG